ncbi:histidine phosphatase family protein [Nocardiopsis ganjiahuensis]|uniref:histidine phosphatase family protein n=1 Tax=Nocardiopsis ganjiahuensis TaxID=239984 RepID=UPI000348CB69|nr:histidine phosphatase family protein [Nocardiopsis ganjiahuensis]
MPTIYLIRHGKASPEAADYDELSPTGYEQARLLGAELKRRELDVGPVVSGSLRRQRQTAATALAEAGIDVEPVVDDRWNEYDHLNLLDRYPIETGSLQQRLDAALTSWTGTGEAGEDSWPLFRDGVRAALGEVAAAVGKGRTALVFTSAGVIGAVCSTLLDTPAAGFIAMNRVVVNGSVSKLVHGRGGTQLLSFNDHAHLEHGGPELMTYR